MKEKKVLFGGFISPDGYGSIAPPQGIPENLHNSTLRVKFDHEAHLHKFNLQT